MNKIGSSSAYYIAIKLASQLSVCAIVWQSYDNCVPKNVTQQIKFQHERSSTTYKKILAQIWRTLKRKISVTCCFTTRYADFGGERGIRTPGTLQYAGFQDRCIRPLCHLSLQMCGRFSFVCGCKGSLLLVIHQIFLDFI